MKNSLLAAALSAGLLCGTTGSAVAATHYRTPAQEVQHKHHMKTAKRVGVGAVGGAVVGGLMGHPVAGAAAGAGGGYLFDKHKKHQGHY